MSFIELVDQIARLLRHRGRISYRVLKREFGLDDAQLEDVKDELIEAQELALDKDGKVLVWIAGKEETELDSQRSQESGNSLPSQSPAAYTPSHMAERILAEQAAMQARGASDGERKTITALFSDLKGSTALIEDLDPEEARAIIDPALHQMMDAVHRYGGYVAQVLGDGIFALFGAPIAHEDHPQRALYAALRMQDELRHYSDQLRRMGHPPLQLRIGVNTGEVVVRSIRKDDLHTDYVPVGLSTNLAARMEQLANPGSILVTAYTYALTEGYFAFNALGETRIKGLGEPLEIYEVQGVGPLKTRLQLAARRGLNRFVGRGQEIAHIRQALAQAQTGQGQIVSVVGEPGVGKSRLCYEYKLTAQRDCLVLEAFAVSHGKSFPYLPVIELLRDYFQITPQDDDRSRREKVLGKVFGLDRSLEDILPFVFSLLGVTDESFSLDQIVGDRQVRRRRTFEAVARLFVRESLNQPVLLIFEDLQWLDSETEAFLGFLSQRVTRAHILLLVNYRPEYIPSWGDSVSDIQLQLGPLRRQEAEELLEAVLGSASDLVPLKQRLLDKTEGNPFFLEELVQTLVEENVLVGERGSYRLEQPAQSLQSVLDLQLSPNVRGVLAARIDRLEADEKALLQTLAVIGREFSLRLLSAVVKQSEEAVLRRLSCLQTAEFIYEQVAFPEVEYAFKHTLTQEVAYTSLLLEQRRVLHERIAQAIEQLSQSGLDEHYSALAHHYGRSGNIPKAVEYLTLAGQQAVQRSANIEAIRNLKEALSLLPTLPDTPERDRQELNLHLLLGAPLQATQGPAAPEVEQTYTRARMLCERVGETTQLFAVLRGLWVLHHVRAELATARELGEQLLTMAERGNDSALLLEAHRALGSTVLWLGEFPLARTHLERVSALYNPHQHRALAFVHGGADPGVSCLSDVARTLWFLGYPDQALERTEAALSLARELSDPFSLGYALVFAAGIHQLRREGRAAQERAEAALTLATEHGFSALASAATIRRGWAFAQQGHNEKGMAEMHQGLAARQASGAGLAEAYFLSLQAEVYGRMGQYEQGLDLLADALTAVETSGEHRLEAELYRLKGKLLLNDERRMMNDERKTREAEPLPHMAEAEACFQRAIAIARRQSAKSLELRAVIGLSRLWQRCGKNAEARQLLAEIDGWFSEGFETADLQEARALLAELE